MVDINVWIAIAYDLHVHHDLAVRWFETLDVEQAVFCRVTQLGVLRLLTHAKIMGSDVMSQSGAWRVFDRLLGDRRVSFTAEPEDVGVIFRRLTHGSRVATKVWMDAYLAAFANAAGLAVVTMDRALANIPGIEAVMLSGDSLS